MSAPVLRTRCRTIPVTIAAGTTAAYAGHDQTCVSNSITPLRTTSAKRQAASSRMGKVRLRQRRRPLQPAAIAMKAATWAEPTGVPSASAVPHMTISARTHRTLIRCKQLIPNPAHRLNGIGFKTMIEPRPQAADVTFDHARARIEMDVPDILQQHLPGNHPIRVPHQVFEQAELLRQQVDQSPCPSDAPMHEIHLYGTSMQARRSVRRPPRRH